MHPFLYPEFADQRRDQLLADAQRHRLRRLFGRRRRSGAGAGSPAVVHRLPDRPATPPEVRAFPTDRKVA
jgi:hypothetical protein